MTRRRTLLPLATLLTAVTLGSCAAPPPSLDPVPLVASAPFICDGVPRLSAELILGGDAEAYETGLWKGDPIAPFDCTITLAGHGDDQRDGFIRVLRNTVAWIGEDTDEFLIQYMGGPEVARPMTAEFPGRGFTSRPDADGRTGAVWVCEGFATKVNAKMGVDVHGRDPEQDAANLLRSMLPWACGDADVPAATK